MASVKTLVNNIKFHSGFKNEAPQIIDGKTVYVLIDPYTETKINLVFWQPEEFADDEYALSIEHHGLEKMNKVGLRRFDNIVSKFNNIPKLTVSIENLNEPILNDEQNKELDKMCTEYNIDVDSINSEALSE